MDSFNLKKVKSLRPRERNTTNDSSRFSSSTDVRTFVVCERCAARIFKFFASFPGIIQPVLTPNPALGTKCDRFYSKPVGLQQ